jgi:hypothetical protein
MPLTLLAIFPEPDLKKLFDNFLIPAKEEGGNNRNNHHNKDAG